MCQPRTARSLVGLHGIGRRGRKRGLEHFYQLIRPHKPMLQDEHGRDDKGETLRDPKTEKYLGKESSHRVSISHTFANSGHRELIPDSANGLNPVATIAGCVQLMT